MNWFQRFPDRLAHEKQVISGLLTEGWVTRADWQVNDTDGIVTAEVDFNAGGRLREANLIYPFVYPFCPLQVKPRVEGQRWSGHQWPNGELCLEMRADNWHSEFDGADMLRSARKLLDTEADVDPAGVPLQVPANHQFTEAQYLNAEPARLVISKDLIAEVARRGPGAHGLDLYALQHERCFVFFAVGLQGSAAHDRWLDAGVPLLFRTKPNRVARVATLEPADKCHLSLIDADRTPEQVWGEFSAIPFSGSGVVIGLLGERVLAKWLLDTNVYDIAEVPMDYQQRAPERNKAAGGKRVAIVGCGSMGSKVAVSLARSGLSDFFLVDGDVLKVGNLVRNELDWREVGAHKVDGVTERLQAIRPDMKVDAWIGRLGGQHSTGNLITCLKKLAACDLIVEVTASGQGFGFASSVATQDRIPMVWGRVFGGGYGGYVARSRPGIEAHPLDVRHEIHTWMTDPAKPKPPHDSDVDYGVEPDDQPAMVADDADVSVISAHLARLALDALRPPEQSDYPNSAYVIGLRKEWIFEQPFETYPIDLRPVPSAANEPQLSTEPMVAEEISGSQSVT